MALYYSEWQQGNSKPKLVGVYQKRLHNGSKIWYGYWNGEYWEQICSSVTQCIEHHKSSKMISVWQNMTWRGLL
jgi:hypothetical protein